MSPIKIDLDVVGHLNGSVSKDVNNLSDLTGSLSALTSQLDSAISARRSVGYRLQNVNHTVQELETKLKTLQFLISQSLERYGQSEKEVVKQASLLTNPPSQTVNDNKHWWDSAFGGLAAGATKLGDFAHQAADEFESGASRLLKNAVGETIDIVAGVMYAKEQAIDFIEDCASEAIQALENSKVGSFVEGAADAVVENFTFGVMESESGTEHRKSYIAGKIVGDLASEIAGLAEGVAGAAITGAGLALDATGVGAIAGVALNAAGVAVVGHASSVLYNGASHTGRDASELVQRFKRSEGAGEGGTEELIKPSKLPDPDAIPSGTRTKIPTNADHATKQSLELENDAADQLAKKGFDIEQNPKVRENDGIDLNRDPDFRIEGKIFDCYSPTENKNIRGIWSEVQEKVVVKQQTKNVVINLKNWSGDVPALLEQFKQWEITGLEEVLAITKNGDIISIFP